MILRALIVTATLAALTASLAAQPIPGPAASLTAEPPATGTSACVPQPYCVLKEPGMKPGQKPGGGMALRPAAPGAALDGDVFLRNGAGPQGRDPLATRQMLGR